MALNRFEGRTAIVTGGGSGIGQATALRFLAEGGRVAAADMSEAGLKDTAEKAAAAGDAELLTTVVLDVSDEASVRGGVATALSALGGGLDILVNAAGILRSAHTDSMPLADWNQVIGINLTGTFLMTREALPALLESAHGGRLVNFSSTSAMFAHPYMAAYAASKGGIQSFTHALASEYADRGLRAVAVQPGSIRSGMTDGSGKSGASRGPGLPEDADMAKFTKLFPAIGEGFAGPESVAGPIAMFASDDGRFITGTELRVDGGTHF
jgi:NAD(P)-dependent dehydrogenase (short-subunit alcohol dehydrogenase family)